MEYPCTHVMIVIASKFTSLALNYIRIHLHGRITRKQSPFSRGTYDVEFHSFCDRLGNDRSYTFRVKFRDCNKEVVGNLEISDCRIEQLHLESSEYGSCGKI